MASGVIDDDSSLFDYKDNAWSSSGQSQEFDGTSHTTSRPSAQVVFGPFTGSSINVFGTVGSNPPTMHYFVDSGAQSLNRKESSAQTTQFRQLLYSATNLDTSRMHTLQINQMDPGTFTLDFVQIDTPQSNQPPPPPPRTVTSTTVSTTTTSASAAASSPTDRPQTTTLTSTSGSLAASTSLTHTHSPSDISMAPGLGWGPGSDTGTATAPTQSQTIPTSGALGSSIDMRIVGAVIGAILGTGLLLILTFLFFRRRHIRATEIRSAGKRKSNSASGLPPKSELITTRKRPSLRITIPSSISLASLTRSNKQPSSLLPSHLSTTSNLSKSLLANGSLSVASSNVLGSSVGTGLGPAAIYTVSPGHAPSFLTEDPATDESPIFDIKQRPVSGATMTTRVTVGTSIGHRVSEPDFSFYPETPMPPMPATAATVATTVSTPSPRATSDGAPSALSLPPPAVTKRSRAPRASYGRRVRDDKYTFDTSGEQPPAAFDTRSAQLRPSGSPRPLPSAPSTRADLSNTFRTSRSFTTTTGRTLGSEELRASRNARDLVGVDPTIFGVVPGSWGREPATPPTEFDSVVHQDAGVRLASNLGGRRPNRGKMDLPPPYQDFQ